VTLDLARRRALLTAALAVALLDTQGKPEPPEQTMIKKWLDNWQGLGHVVTGMNRQGYMLSLTNVDVSTWRATFSSAPMLASDGFGTGATPWRAVQEAAWTAGEKRCGLIGCRLTRRQRRTTRYALAQAQRGMTNFKTCSFQGVAHGMRTLSGTTHTLRPIAHPTCEAVPAWRARHPTPPDPCVQRSMGCRAPPTTETLRWREGYSLPALPRIGSPPHALAVTVVSSAVHVTPALPVWQ